MGRLGAHCLTCGTAVSLNEIRAQGKAGRMSQNLLAVVADGPSGRVYLSPPNVHAVAARVEPRIDFLDIPLPNNPRDFKTPNYGMRRFCDLFTPRQLVALTTFSDLVGQARERVLAGAIAAGRPDDGIGIADGGTGAQAYSDAVATYLAFAVDRLSDYSSTICSWHVSGEKMRNTFGRQAIPMTWDFAEVNPFSESSGNFTGATEWIWKVLQQLPASGNARVIQQSATEARPNEATVILSTDPPYYDNIGYADLADYFYVWMRRALSGIYPSLFSTRLTPKSDELIASPYRHGGSRTRAQQFFEEGLGDSFQLMHDIQNRDFPMTVYYAYKQGEADDGEGVVSTGWETMLQGMIDSELQITGTWPMRTEMGVRMIGHGNNALASSIVIVCRSRPGTAQIASRRDFLTALRSELDRALIELQHASIAPVDLAQTAIGPGMAVFSRYAKVLEADGTPMRVRTALQLINQELDAFLTATEGELDPDTRFCVAWFEEVGFDAGQYGRADVLARAKNATLTRLEHSGVLESKGGKVRLLKPAELDPKWDPATDRRTNIWECTHQLIRLLNEKGEAGAGEALAQLSGDLRERVKALAYRLYGICDRKKWSELALAYNALGQSWTEIQRLADDAQPGGPTQQPLL